MVPYLLAGLPLWLSTEAGNRWRESDKLSTCYALLSILDAKTNTAALALRRSDKSVLPHPCWVVPSSEVYDPQR